MWRRGVASATLVPCCWLAKDDEFSASVVGHPALKHGWPQTGHVAASESFVVSFDYRTRNPAWVVEVLTNESVKLDEAKRELRFREATAIPERLRSRLDDYSGSGYDRGHLAAAADHKHSQRAMHDTFSLVNVSPQVGVGFNRDYWARLEKFVRDVAKKGVADKVTVITGPLFVPSGKADWPVIGVPPSLVHVPTHFFKIILAESPGRAEWAGSGYAIGAFVVPNKPIDADTPLLAFLAPVEAVEAAAGLLVFSKLLTAERRQALRDAEARHLQRRRAQPILATGTQDRRPSSTAAASDLSHLCDRTKCELVTAAWLKQFENKKASDS